MVYFISDQSSWTERLAPATIDDSVAYCKGKDVLGVDTETTGQFDHSNRIIMFQIGDEDRQFVIDARSKSILKFKEILESKEIEKVFWNVKFDHKFLKQEGIELERVFDGFLAEKALYNGIKSRGLSLEAAAYNYMGAELDKSQRGQFSEMKEDAPFTEKQIRYGAEDVEHLIGIYKQQKEKMREWSMLNEASLENKYILAHADMEYYGININTEKWLELEGTKQEEYEKARERLDAYVVENDLRPFIDYQQDMFDSRPKSTIKWTSEKQVADLCDHIGLDTTIEDPDTGGTKRSTSEGHMLKWKEEFPEFVELLLDFREKKKQVESYGKQFLLHVNKRTGRIHSDFFPFINTGRISSDSPNLQNIPNEDADPRYRQCFEAPEGKKLIVSDLSQQEPRITASKSEDATLIEFFRSGDGDTHSLVATLISPLVYGERVQVKKGENDPYVKDLGRSLRAIGKTTNLGLDYGKSAFSLKDDLSCSEEMAQQIIDKISEELPGKDQYFKKKHKEVLTKGYITIDEITGRKFFINDFDRIKELEAWMNEEGFWKYYREEKKKNSEKFQEELKPNVRYYFKRKGELERDAQNYPIQGTGASMTKWSAVLIRNELKKRGCWGKPARIVMLLHDEVVVECNESLSEEISELVKEKMEEAGRVFCKQVNMLAEPVITDHWTH